MEGTSGLHGLLLVPCVRKMYLGTVWLFTATSAAQRSVYRIAHARAERGRGKIRLGKQKSVRANQIAANALLNSLAAISQIPVVARGSHAHIGLSSSSEYVDVIQ